MANCTVCGRSIWAPKSLERMMGSTCASKGSSGRKRSKKTRSRSKISMSAKIMEKPARQVLGKIAQISMLGVPTYFLYPPIHFGTTLIRECLEGSTVNEALKESTKEAILSFTNSVSREIVAEKAPEIAETIRNVAEDSGLIKKVSEITNINETVYGDMLEGSIEKGLVSSTSMLTNFTVRRALDHL